jgi:GTP-binding protein EngB required for normal cell division
MTVFLEGAAAQFYREIGAETQYIAPFGTMNFFIGANNAGKSIVLNLIADHVESWPHGKVWGRLKEFESYKWPERGSFKFAID